MKRPWRCENCNARLADRQRDHLEIQFARGHRYVASLPATAACRRCGRLNHLMNEQTEVNGTR